MHTVLASKHAQIVLPTWGHTDMSANGHSAGHQCCAPNP